MAQKLRRLIPGGRMESRIVNAVGVWFYSEKTDRFLYLMRNDPKHPFNWGLPGGKCENNETLLDTVYRECQEELGMMPDYTKLAPLEKFTSKDEVFCYHTFFCLLENEFNPVLNDEHVGYAWITSKTWPRPMHPGLWATVHFHDIIQKVSTLKNSYVTV